MITAAYFNDRDGHVIEVGANASQPTDIRVAEYFVRVGGNCTRSVS